MFWCHRFVSDRSAEWQDSVPRHSPARDGVQQENGGRQSKYSGNNVFSTC